MAMTLYERFSGRSSASTEWLTTLQMTWVRWAIKMFQQQQDVYEMYESYYVGDHPLAFATEKWTEVFETEFEEFADNWCQVVVDAVTQRLEIDGWDSEDDKAAATKAEQIWDDNKLGTEADDLHTQTLTKGDGFLMCWPAETNDREEGVDIYYNDALDIRVFYDPSDRRKIIHAAKKWIDEDGWYHLRIYYPDYIEQYFAKNMHMVNPDLFLLASTPLDPETASGIPIPPGWELEGDPIPNPYGEIPVFHFKNRNPGGTHGLSEIKSVIPVQNAVNKLWMDLMVSSEFGSFRQKWMTGGGHPKDGWKSGANRIWASTDPSSKFGDFSQNDLEPYNRIIEMAVGHIAKITQTPMHYLRTSGDMPSGEALKTAESGLVHKVKARQKQYGAAWSKAMSLAVEISTGTKPRSPVFPIWRSAETRHDLEQAQTAQLKAILGIPLEQLWREHFNYTEEEIKVFKAQNQNIFADLLQAVLAQTGQLPPGLQEAMVGSPVISTPGKTLDSKGNVTNDAAAPQLTLPQVLALLPKSITAQTPAGEATTKPQANTRPPGSPTRRSTGFDRGVGKTYQD